MKIKYMLAGSRRFADSFVAICSLFIADCVVHRPFRVSRDRAHSRLFCSFRYFLQAFNEPLNKKFKCKFISWYYYSLLLLWITMLINTIDTIQPEVYKGMHLKK